MDETHLTQLGREARGFASPEEAVLERVPNPQADTLYLARFTAPDDLKARATSGSRTTRFVPPA